VARKILLYIIYGDDQVYYDGAKFGILTFKGYMPKNDDTEFVVLTERPEMFEGIPAQIFTMSREQVKEWSLNGSYHFRIKNRGLAYMMDKLSMDDDDKLLFVDADIYFNQNPAGLFDRIRKNQALYYRNEGLIYEKKRFHIYVDSLENKMVKFDGGEYSLSKKSAMWGSAMMGLMPNMRMDLDIADKLMSKLVDIVPAHTVEPFSFSEILLRTYSMVEGKDLVGLYSTSGKKKHAALVLSDFFRYSKGLSVDNKISKAGKVRIKRYPWTIIKQRFIKIFKLDT